MSRMFFGVFVLIAMIVGLGAVAAQDQKMSEEEENYVKEMNERYQKIFGKLPIFNLEKKNEDFLGIFLFIKPQPVSECQDLEDKILAPRLLAQSQYWIDTILRESVRPKPVEKSPPEKYYLPRLRGEKHPYDLGLLLHEWKTNKYRFTMYESGAAMLLRVAPLEYKAGDPLPAKRLAAIVREVLHHDYNAANEKDAPQLLGKVAGYGSDEEFIKAFRLPEKVGPGTVFHQLEHLRFAWSPANWPMYVVGFISDRDICLVCYKRVGYPATGFLQRDPVWLNHNLFAKDGKTLLAPVSPKIGRD